MLLLLIKRKKTFSNSVYDTSSILGISPPKPLVSMQLRKAKIDLEVIRSNENERQLKSLVYKSLSKGVKAKARRLRWRQDRSTVNEKKRSQKLVNNNIHNTNHLNLHQIIS